MTIDVKVTSTHMKLPDFPIPAGQELIEPALTGALEERETHALSAVQDTVEDNENGCAASAVYADDPYANHNAYLTVTNCLKQHTALLPATVSSTYAWDNATLHRGSLTDR